jgi:hypothetical protein
MLQDRISRKRPFPYQSPFRTNPSTGLQYHVSQLKGIQYPVTVLYSAHHEDPDLNTVLYGRAVRNKFVTVLLDHPKTLSWDNATLRWDNLPQRSLGILPPHWQKATTVLTWDNTWGWDNALKQDNARRWDNELRWGLQEWYVYSGLARLEWTVTFRADWHV